MALGWGEARQAAYDAVAPLAPVAVPAPEGLGLRLALPLVAADDLPRFDNAAMDGFAVAGEGPWRVRGATLAGRPGATTPLAAGQAWQVTTGAPLPPGAEAVLPVEHASVTAGRVAGRIAVGRHVRRRGEEAVAGEKLLDAGARVTPQVVALAAAAGAERLVVHRRPRVVALVTGDELGTGPGQVRDALGPALPGWVDWAGGHLDRAIRVRDGADPLMQALTGALTGALTTAAPDLVVVTGSSSAGPEDHLRAVIASMGAVAVVDGVDCRPGSLAGLWRLPGGAMVAGLPGNPLAALAAFVTVAAPALAGLRGEAMAPLDLVVADLPTRHAGHGGGAPGGAPTARRPGARLLPVRLAAQGPVPLGHDRSGMLRGVAAADALAVIPGGAAPGVPVEVTLHPLPQ